MKKRVEAMLWVLLVVLVAMLLVGLCTGKPTQRMQSTYTVRQGDRLYDIAADLGVDDWRKWCYEVCRMNGIKDGGVIYPGDRIIIYTEAE